MVGSSCPWPYRMTFSLRLPPPIVADHENWLHQMRSSQRGGVPGQGLKPPCSMRLLRHDYRRTQLQLVVQRVLGRSGGRLSITLLWGVLFYGWTASEIYVAIATRTRRGHGKRLDRGSMAILWVTILASISSRGMDSRYIAAKHVRRSALVEGCCHHSFWLRASPSAGRQSSLWARLSAQTTSPFEILQTVYRSVACTGSCGIHPIPDCCWCSPRLRCTSATGWPRRS